MFHCQKADDQPKDRNDQQAEHTHLIHFHQGCLDFRQRPAHENTRKVSFRNRIAYYQHRRIKNLAFSQLIRYDFSVSYSLRQLIINKVISNQNSIKTGRCQHNFSVTVHQNDTGFHITFQDLQFITQFTQIPCSVCLTVCHSNFFALTNQFFFLFSHVVVSVNDRQRTAQKQDQHTNGRHI